MFKSRIPNVSYNDVVRVNVTDVISIDLFKISIDGNQVILKLLYTDTSDLQKRSELYNQALNDIKEIVSKGKIAVAHIYAQSKRDKDTFYGELYISEDEKNALSITEYMFRNGYARLRPSNNMPQFAWYSVIPYGNTKIAKYINMINMSKVEKKGIWKYNKY